MVETEFEMKEKVAIVSILLIIVGFILAFSTLAFRETEKGTVACLSVFSLVMGFGFILWLRCTRNTESDSDEQLYYLSETNNSELYSGRIKYYRTSDYSEV